MKRLRACILGATGIVGQQFIRVLEGHPHFETSLLTASQQSAGRPYDAVADWVMPGEIPDSVRDLRVVETAVDPILDADVDVVFSALPSDIANDIELDLARAGLAVFSNSSAHRMSPDVPILIPEINPDHLDLVRAQEHDGLIVTNSNCSTSGLVFGLRPIMDWNISRVFVTTYQAVSGAGRTGVASMDILGNVIPFIDGEEPKLETEPRKILGEFDGDQIEFAEFKVHASCARVPVVNGHLESVVVELEDVPTVADVVSAYERFSGPPQQLGLHTAPDRPIVVMTGPDRPQPQRDLFYDDPLGMSVKIGRIRIHDGLLSLFLLVHNAVRGAAGASVLNAEFALAKGLLSKEV